MALKIPAMTYEVGFLIAQNTSIIKPKRNPIASSVWWLIPSSIQSVISAHEIRPAFLWNNLPAAWNYISPAEKQ